MMRVLREGKYFNYSAPMIERHSGRGGGEEGVEFKVRSQLTPDKTNGLE